MAGTDEDAVAAEDDALYVLTAVLLTPAKFPSVLGDDYPEACAALGLPPLADGYGLVLGQDGDGARWTVVVDDVSLVAVAVASWDCGMEYDLSPDERTVVAALPGWPLAVAVAAPGVPAPHDPDLESADQPALSPPDTTVWGPAQRRLGADEIAAQWAQWREQIDDADFPVTGGDAGSVDDSPGDEAAEDSGAGEGAGNDATNEAGTADAGAGTTDAGAGAGTTDAGDGSSGHGGVRRVLAEARAYVDTPPPLGRVRSSFAPGDARTLRADGPGWSLVARTDDIAFILLDEEPGEVLPVGRGPSLPGLLEALDKMAVRPS
ncbi:hypothetical protein RI578_33805 [Streptomyces sp. BB1-1-1]|uniref:hypothetical protein n=1 Tax=Streptomyces sp. BB1-1-1 TaxID=3074430 RepID=UPI0028772B73|nr:hypothetical protein [Streptomyces sp. BB1-1-1]WND38960.1 hypothetical protein RI578_33805 [Streptomyces sp. BB1-1-1]